MIERKLKKSFIDDDNYYKPVLIRIYEFMNSMKSEDIKIKNYQ